MAMRTAIQTTGSTGTSEDGTAGNATADMPEEEKEIIFDTYQGLMSGAEAWDEDAICELCEGV